MGRLKRSCVVGSVVFHALILAMLVLGPMLLAKREEKELALLEFAIKDEVPHTYPPSLQRTKAEAVRVGLWHHRPAGVDKVGGVGSVAMLGVERSVLEQPWRARGVDGSLTATACASPVHGFIDSLDFVGETRGEPGRR